jgi:hypothetical protein
VPIMKGELAKQCNKTDASAVITKRVNFMKNLEKWFDDLGERGRAQGLPAAKILDYGNMGRLILVDEWRLCSVCVIFRRIPSVDLSYGSAVNGWAKEMLDRWTCVKRGWKGFGQQDQDESVMWICPRHDISPQSMVQLRKG